MLNLNFGAKKGGDGAADGDVFDVGEADFMEKVVEASRTRPVIVDFWATWCGPCKQLQPALEAAVKAQGGKVALAKVDVDANQMIAEQMRIQSIPAVYAFVDGRPIDGFMGALPDSQVKQFVEQVAKAGGPGASQAADVDTLIEAAETALKEGAIGDAAQAFAAVLQVEPTELRAIAGLARCYAAGGDLDRARQTLEMAPTEKAEDPAIVAARAAIDLAEQSAGRAAEVAANRAAVDADPSNHQARFDLAMGLVALGDREGAVDMLIEIVRRDQAWNDDAAKQQLFKLFDAFGASDPLTLAGRRRLASVLLA